MAVIDVELIEVLTDELPIDKLVSFRTTLLPKAILADWIVVLTVELPTKNDDTLTVTFEPTVTKRTLAVLVVNDVEVRTELTVELPTFSKGIRSADVLIVTFEPTVITFVANKLPVDTDVELTTALTDELPTVNVVSVRTTLLPKVNWVPCRAILPAWIVVLTVELPTKIVDVLIDTFEPTVIVFDAARLLADTD